jgi:hypothetical protein
VSSLSSARAGLFYDTTSLVHDTLALIDVGDTLGSPGTAVPVSVYLNNFADSIQGFTISVTLSQLGLMAFEADTVLDTCYPCLDELCEQLDTVLCTVHVVPSTVQNTLIQNWDFATARTTGGTNVRITGLADVDYNHSPLPILPFTNGVLIKVVAQIACNIQDDVIDRTVLLNVNAPQTYIANTKGVTAPSTIITDQDTTIQGTDTTIWLSIYKPAIKITNGSITVAFTTKGDLNKDGAFDVLDVVIMVNTAFRGGEEPCPPGIADLNCDGAIDILDVVLLVNHTFRGGPQPIC